MAAKFRNIYHKVRCADCENVFLIHPRECLKKAFCKVGVWIEKWFSNTSQSSFRIVLLLFCYFFNYALFYFIFIQSFCFNQNCLKVYFYITIYFSEDFYCSFACFVVQSTLSRSLLHYRVVKCHLLDFIVCFSRFLFYKSYYYILYLP